jgi:hypothetical protein
MGVWGYALLEGDAPLDYIGSQSDQLHEDIERFGHEKASEVVAARLGAAVGLLLQFDPWWFGHEEAMLQLNGAIERQRNCLDALPSRARKVLQQIVEGPSRKLLERQTRGVDRRIQKALGNGRGYREATLFEHPAAAAYAQQFAKSCVQSIEEEMRSQGETWMEDVEGFMGIFALLLLIEPCKVSTGKIRAWRKKIRAIYAKEGKDRRPFVEKYMKNVETAFEVALEKFSAS